MCSALCAGWFASARHRERRISRNRWRRAMNLELLRRLLLSQVSETMIEAMESAENAEREREAQMEAYARECARFYIRMAFMAQR